ncbi:hypothetical protein SAMN06297129_2171 [Pseudooceanicola antarcticus]|uniref:Uncharacterized protein n=1 Tax=Pseudooceanicola antarcticus TaxID=1247613 RepID=A0A285IU82_9RHOB|nr:hypothetical protein SAMN06297129_2171 [Pseudooceanicola antarcticus]
MLFACVIEVEDYDVLQVMQHTFGAATQCCVTRRCHSKFTVLREHTDVFGVNTLDLVACAEHKILISID